MFGTALFNGDGVKRDPILGYAYVSRAAAQGLAPAQATLEQLDQILPVEQRKKALAIAMAKAKAAPPPSSRPVAAPHKTRPDLAKAKPEAVAIAKSVKPRTAAGGARRTRKRRLANPARRLFAAQFGGSAIPESVGLRSPGDQPFYVAAGPVTRLQVGPYPTRAAASAACAALHGQACFAVAGKVASRETSRGGGCPGPRAAHRAHDA